MQLNLLENSMDSLSEAIDYYTSGKKYSDERCYKFCIFLLYHSAELILKEILNREHKVFIYERIEDYVNKKNMQTIGFRKALERVRSICDIDLRNYHSYLDDLAALRNKIQHYEINADVSEMTKTIISSFSAIEYLVLNVLNTDFNAFGEHIDDSQINTLHKDKEAYDKRKTDIRNDIKTNNHKRVTFEYAEGKYLNIPCPDCAETYLIKEDDNEIKCLFCGEHYKSMEELYSHDRHCIIKDYMERELGKRTSILDDLLECPYCNYTTLIRDESNLSWKCGACGTTPDNDDLTYVINKRGREDWEADIADMMEDEHYSHLWK